jgi:hypothetical protein
MNVDGDALEKVRVHGVCDSIFPTTVMYDSSSNLR